MKENKVSNNRLAFYIGVSKGTLSRIRQGYPCRPLTALKICQFFKIPFKEDEWKLSCIPKKNFELKDSDGYEPFNVRFKEGEKVKVPFRKAVSDCDARKKIPMLRGTILKKYKTYVLVDVKVNDHLNLKKGYSYIDIEKC